MLGVELRAENHFSTMMQTEALGGVRESGRCLSRGASNGDLQIYYLTRSALITEISLQDESM